MRIKDLAILSDTTVRTIRYYHQLGLLAVPPSTTTWRAYGFGHLTRLMRIRWLVDSGVPLAEVAHMLMPPDGTDERSLVIEDLAAVLSSIDAKTAVLAAQRERVEILLERVRRHGRLSPLPPPVVRVYAALIERPLPAGMHEAMSRERDLLELACYRGAMPSDLTALLDAVTEDDLDELCRLWEECHQLAVDSEPRPWEVVRQRVGDLVRRTVDLAIRIEPDASLRLLRYAAELDRPAVRAAVHLAYPSPVYREFVRGFLDVAKAASSA
ncbi:MerR family transcriptional regulator [Dermatophilaceae bacterium Soc4.6]